MKKSLLKKIISSSVVISLLFAVCSIYGSIVEASSLDIDGDYYVLDEESEYEIAKTTPTCRIDSHFASKYGKFSLDGNIKKIDSVNGFRAYEVTDGNVLLDYSLLDIYVDAADDEWHICDDWSKEVDGMKLDERINSGAVIIQTSLDGKKWINDVVYTDVQNPESHYKVQDYYTNDIQLTNGSYYRVIVAYELRELDETYIGFIDTYDYNKYAEVYEFYLQYSEDKIENNVSPDAEPKKTLGKTVSVKTNEGYTGESSIVYDDPHYGWKLGSFWINGYTSEKENERTGESIFLKSLGDNVVLWFNLENDIDRLNDNEELVICEDNGAYDEHFQIAKTNFKHGALIIQFTDYQGIKHDPIIYTDFLAANTKTGADTRVQLFEEGDYEVSLDYGINDTHLLDKQYYYRMSFSFSIRNSNCMAYPFDSITGQELKDNAITGNGFRLDCAKSRYLVVDIERYTISFKSGRYFIDERLNEETKENKVYAEEGIYVFDVTNTYTGQDTKKTIYVGSTPILLSLSKGNTLDDINTQIAEGYTLNPDGTLTAPPTPTPTPILTPEVLETEVNETVETSGEVLENTSSTEVIVQEDAEATKVIEETNDVITQEKAEVTQVVEETNNESSEVSATINSTENDVQEDESKAISLYVWVIVVIIVLIIIFVLIQYFFPGCMNEIKNKVKALLKKGA